MSAAVITDPQAIGGAGMALALGLLMGIQRGWAQRGEPAGHRFAGIRTFGLLGLAGGIAGAIQARAASLTLVLLLAAAALVVLGYWRGSQKNSSISGTASISGLITLAAGYLAGTGGFAFASALTGLTVLVLSQRRRLHHALRHLDEAEMIAIARFGLIALVILPLLPNVPMGPLDAWRPRQLWLVVVLVSGFSFAGYAGVKMLGPSRGVLATAAAGAMVSSTAVTASLGGKLREETANVMLLNAGIALASATMFLRVVLLTAALAPFALPSLAGFALPGLVTSLAACLWLLRRHQGAGSQSAAIALKNPFELKPALLLMILTMLLTLAARWVLERYGHAGLATVLAISGAVDVDSAVITMGNLPDGALEPRLAGLILCTPIVLNTLFKSATLFGLAGRKGAPAITAMLASVAMLGGAVALLW